MIVKEYVPQRSLIRVIEPRRVIAPVKKRRRFAWRRWLLIVPGLLSVISVLAVADYINRLRSGRDLLLRFVDSQGREISQLTEQVQHWKQSADEQQTLRSGRESDIASLEARLALEAANANRWEQSQQATTRLLRELESRLATSEQLHRQQLAECEASQKQLSQERDNLQQGLLDLAQSTVHHLITFGDAVASDPVIAREVFTVARQIALKHGLASDTVDQRLLTLPIQRVLPDGSRLWLSDVTTEGGQIAAIVVVQNANREFVHDLRRSDIEVRSDVKRLHAVSFHEARRKTARHEIAVLLDVSGSTMGVAHATVKTVASQFVRFLANPNRLRVWKFADAVEAISPWSVDPELHEQAIAELTAGGGTALYQAVRTAAENLSGDHGARAIVLFTDGKDSSRVESVDHTLELCRQRAIPIHVVMLETQETDESLLRRMATETGGTFHRAGNPAQLADQFREVALSFMQPCYRLQINDPVGSGPVTLQVGDLPAVSLTVQP